MNENLTELAKRLEQNRQKEIEQVKQIEAEKLKDLTESLTRSYTSALATIESDMTARLNNLQKAMTEARQKIIEQEKAMLKEISENRAEIEDEALTLMQNVNRVKTRYWITPLLVGTILTIALALGLWGVGVIISDRYRTLKEVNEQIEQTKASFKARGIETDGDYLILPRGLKATTGYNHKDGREAIKIAR